MVPVGEMSAQMKWGCTNRWHPHNPGPCPGCGHAGRPRSSTLETSEVARCSKCGHEWVPPAAGLHSSSHSTLTPPTAVLISKSRRRAARS
jgi:hypothetical protein